MEQAKPAPEALPVQAEPPAPVGAVPRPWTVKFVVPPQEGMPSDRLKARAEMARIASGCDCCLSGGY